MNTAMLVFAFLITHWDVILLSVGFALAALAVIAKRTKNTVDDEIVETAQELLQVARTVPVKPKPAPVPAPAPVPVKPRKATPLDEASDVLETAGKVFDVVDKVAPTVTAPVRQGAALIGVLAGLAKVFRK
jgi:hypothetical protein